MGRTLNYCLIAAMVSGVAGRAHAILGAEPPPLTYELMINGESFPVEANRMTKLESKEKPGTRYTVAIRVAPQQRVRLNTLQFEYNLPAKVEDDGGRQKRSARLTHELGFTMLLTDLGPPMEAASQTEALKILTESVTESFRESKVTKLDVSKPHDKEFSGCSGRGVTMRYRDTRDFGHTCLVYLLTGPKFSASCVVQYLDNDAEDALPLVKKALDSVAGLP